MVCESYAYFYNSSEDITQMMNLMNEYQTQVKSQFNNPDYELTKVCFCKLKIETDGFNYVLLFGLGAGFENCLNHFSANSIKLVNLEEYMLKLIEPQENWLCIFRDYKFFEPNFIDKLKANGLVD